MRRLWLRAAQGALTARTAVRWSTTSTPTSRTQAIAVAVAAAAERIPLHLGDASRPQIVTLSQVLSLVQERMPDDISTPVTFSELEEALARTPEIVVLDKGDTSSPLKKLVTRRASASQPPASEGSTLSAPAAAAPAPSIDHRRPTPTTDPLSRPHLFQLASQLHHSYTELSSQARPLSGRREVMLSDVARRCLWSSNDVANVLDYVIPRLQKGPFAVPPSATATGETPRDRETLDARSQHTIPMLRAAPIVHVRPKLSPRACHLLVDGDGLTCADVALLMEALQVQAARSTRVVVRSASTGPHSPHDIVAPHGVPPYLLLEKEALSLSGGGQTVVLKDVVYMCASDKFHLFVDHVSRAVAFPDCSVLVCCPDQMAVVSASSSGEGRWVVSNV